MSFVEIKVSTGFLKKVQNLKPNETLWDDEHTSEKLLPKNCLLIFEKSAAILKFRNSFFSI